MVRVADSKFFGDFDIATKVMDIGGRLQVEWSGAFNGPTASRFIPGLIEQPPTDATATAVSNAVRIGGVDTALAVRFRPSTWEAEAGHVLPCGR